MNRRAFLQTAAFGAIPRATLAGAEQGPAPPSRVSDNASVEPFAWQEATLAQLRAAMNSGQESSASLVEKYIRRIEGIDRRGPALNSIIELNPDAAGIAASLDSEQKATGPRGPLHGI